MSNPCPNNTTFNFHGKSILQNRTCVVLFPFKINPSFTSHPLESKSSGWHQVIQILIWSGSENITHLQVREEGGSENSAEWSTLWCVQGQGLCVPTPHSPSVWHLAGSNPLSAFARQECSGSSWGKVAASTETSALLSSSLLSQLLDVLKASRSNNNWLPSFILEGEWIYLL